MDAVSPRLVPSEEIRGYLGGICAATYAVWQAKGIVPGPVPGTNRYDVKAHDGALDRLAGLDKPLAASPLRSPLEEWEADHAAQP